MYFLQSKLILLFYFAHHSTKLTINGIYNSHYSGSNLWNLFGNRAKKFESSYNRSVKTMMGLPLNTHRNLIEPLSGERHVKLILISRFLGFMEKICTSKKKALKMLMETAKLDTRSVTGQNFRNIMILVGKTSIDAVKKEDAFKIKYFPIDEADYWKVNAIKEIIDVKNQLLEVPDLDREELDEILNNLCTS